MAARHRIIAMNFHKKSLGITWQTICKPISPMATADKAGGGILSAWGVNDRFGQRKYLTRRERDAFLRTAATYNRCVHSFCWMLAATGCRISEALSLSETSIDFEAGQVVIRSLKKRGRKVFRTVPLPPALLFMLQEGLEAGLLCRDRLWPWSRMTGYRRVREVMRAAKITGRHASPKGLRHAFGVCAIQSNVPLNLIQRWLGHADIKTTTIYTDAMGPEERQFAARMWLTDSTDPSIRPARGARHSVASLHDVAGSVDTPQVSETEGTETGTDRPATAGEGGSLLNLANMLNAHVGDSVYQTRRIEELERRLISA